jgi:protein O-GlcNAc transferase
VDLPAPMADEFAEAARLHQAGDLDRAEAAYRRILAARPGHADAAHLLGVLEHQRGHHEAAAGRIGSAIARAPGRADYRSNLGTVLRALGRLDEAVAAYREALRLAPDYPDALANLGVVFHDLGRLDEALPPFEAALRLDPDHVNAAFGLANLLVDLGQPGRAVPLYRRARSTAPGRADISDNLAAALTAAGDAQGGLAASRSAAEASPSDPATLAGLGRNLERLDRVEEAAEAYVAAARLLPGQGHWPVRIAALCPAVFPSTGAIDRYRIGLEAVLDAHRAGLRLGPAELLTSGCVPSFQLPHHGRDDRPIMARFAALFRSAFPDRGPAAGDGPPHVGFVVTRGREGGFARGMAGIVDGLEPGRFLVSVFAAPGGLPALRAAIRRPGTRFVPIPDRLPTAADRVAAARCDVLYHWQVGPDPLGYFLPFARPAPVQCTSWGTHVTSGIPAVAYYLSSGLIEPPGSEAHYTEELVRMATLPTFQRPVPRPDPPAGRAEFGLPEGRHLYACLQRLAKIHPDFDPILAGILRRDPAGLVLLLEDPAPHATGRLRRRLAATMPDVVDRVAFLARRPFSAYLRLLSLADVVLDPLHYGSGLTAYDILGLGLPLVTLPGDRHVGRYATGCYRRMGIAGPVAASPDQYVEVAVRLGIDRDYRADVAGRIAGAAAALFEDAGAVAEHGRFFERAARLAREK